MNTRYLKEKGRKFQQKVRDMIIEEFNFPESDVRSCSMGAPGVDIQLSEMAKEQFPFSVECKNVKKLSPLSEYYNQAVSNCVEETKPVLVSNMPDGQTLVTMSIEDFLFLAKNFSTK